ncbi:adenylyl-sulfate kinase [Phreatobacter aquaticus]|uniref:Adenylyl-sulfate kinase n=1 Tax=Phreatobacter aquaticus TaxID=2570229 RepID=A0A4D7QSX8_9HYPH|nr:adenylyl-sulfate kinase [Phreatobacter aquaticus]QCK88167.1 adenylyl-sulfate kinase [Phreatobacter aquaticus]
MPPSSMPPAYSLPRLRFMTCGAVDDGKSTLMGRLLYECGAIYDDQLDEVRRASGSTSSDGLDLAFVVDGLKIEREQGITIDVAYRYFSTDRRAFLIADAPGHEQYTRNQAAAASQSDIAVVVVSAVDGMRIQTRRHLTIAAMFGVNDIIVAISKMDLAGFSEARFQALAGEMQAFAAQLGIHLVACMPIAARDGDNVTTRSGRMPWYQGPPLLELLEQAKPRQGQEAALRLPVQVTGRMPGGGRVSLGTIASGTIGLGMRVAADPAFPAEVVGLWEAGNAVTSAEAGAAVSVELAPDVDIGRGAVLSAIAAPAQPALQLRARLVWLDPTPLMTGRDYDCQISTQKVGIGISRIEGVVDLDTARPDQNRSEVALNDIAEVLMTLSTPAVAMPFEMEPRFGAFILVDRATRATIAAGIVLDVTRRVADLPWQAIEVTPAARASLLRQSPFVLWFTGLSGAGKSTISGMLDRRLHALGRNTVVLDGDNLRHGLNADLGFSDADRVENMRRVAHAANLMADAGLIVLVSLISPFAAERTRARDVIGSERFVEVFVDASIETCRQRDPKGHYARAASGQLRQFTGVSAVYEPPDAPDIHLHTDTGTPVDMTDEIIAHLRKQGLLAG